MILKGTPDMTTSSSADAKIKAIKVAQSGSAFEANTWGYNVQAGANKATDVSATYNPVSSAGDTVVDKKALGNTMSANDTYTLNFGAKVDTSIPAGTYASTVTLSVVASPKLVTGFDRTDTMQGMTAEICKEIGSAEDLASGTAAKYKATDSLGNTYYTKRLKDTRDQKWYWVAKLADGNCWMTQNLALDIPAEGLTSVDTALNLANADPETGIATWKPIEATRNVTKMTEAEKAERFVIEECANLAGDEERACLNRNAGYSWDEGEYVLVYPRARSGVMEKLAVDNAGLADYSDPANIPSDIPREMLTKNGQLIVEINGDWTPSSDPKFTESNSGYAVDMEHKVYDSHYLIGNYYQWFAAIAKTLEEGRQITESGQIVEGSICAKGWELPTSGSYGTGAGQATGNATFNNANNSYFNLITKTADNALVTTGTSEANSAQVNNGYSKLNQIISGVGDAAIETRDILTGNPLHFVRSGHVYVWRDKQYVGSVANWSLYWSSVNFDTFEADILNFNTGTIYPSSDSILWKSSGS